MSYHLARWALRAAAVGIIAINWPLTAGAGGASLPHRHDAQVLVYVLDGRVRMQVDGAAPVTLGPGDTFYEGPGDIHRVSANASSTLPARILVFIVKDKGTPISSAVAPSVQP